MFDPRSVPVLADAGALLDEFVPTMLELLDRPHLESTATGWYALRSRLDEIFKDGGWTADESRVAFDLLVAVAEAQHA